jgi:purine-nucleoside phosphorylase
VKATEQNSGVSPGKADAKAAAALLHNQCLLRPTLALVLGSGFQRAVAQMRVVAEVPFARLPGFPKPAVAGHAGRVLLGHLGGASVVVLSGRGHFYEGHPMETVTLPVRALAALGVRDLLITNAAGGINRSFRAGDFMRITDHINLMGVNPLRGVEMTGLPRFVDLTQVYDATLGKLLEAAGRKAAVRLRSGVYLAVSGPSYETPAEIRALARLGADAVGMSTVPEAIVARQCGLCVAGLSCITNLAAGRSRSALSHSEVLATGKRVEETAARLLMAFAELYAKSG